MDTTLIEHERRITSMEHLLSQISAQLTRLQGASDQQRQDAQQRERREMKELRTSLDEARKALAEQKTAEAPAEAAGV